jgi:hypothetical protein
VTPNLSGGRQHQQNLSSELPGRNGPSNHSSGNQAPRLSSGLRNGQSPVRRPPLLGRPRSPSPIRGLSLGGSPRGGRSIGRYHIGMYHRISDIRYHHRQISLGGSLHGGECPARLHATTYMHASRRQWVAGAWCCNLVNS